jgi:hypothetical protein
MELGLKKQEKRRSGLASKLQVQPNFNYAGRKMIFRQLVLNML